MPRRIDRRQKPAWQRSYKPSFPSKKRTPKDKGRSTFKKRGNRVKGEKGVRIKD